MNRELVVKDKKAIVITDGETKEVENFSMLPEYMELENLKEQMEKEISKLDTQDIEKKADNFVKIFNFIRPVFVALLIIAVLSSIWYYLKAFWFVLGDIECKISIIPFLALLGEIGLMNVVDEAFDKKHDIKGGIIKILSKLDESKKKKINDKLSIVKNRLTFLELKKEQERKEAEQIVKDESEVVSEVPQEESIQKNHYVFQPMSRSMQKEHLKRLKEIYMNDTYSVIEHQSFGEKTSNVLSQGKQLIKKYMNK